MGALTGEVSLILSSEAEDRPSLWPAVPLLIQTLGAHVRTFLAAVSNSSKCPLVVEYMTKCDIVIQQILVNKNEVQLDAITWMNLEHMVSKKKAILKEYI